MRLPSERVYGTRATAEQMAARAKREGFDANELREAQEQSRHYWVRVWCRPTNPRVIFGPTGPEEVPAYWVYRVRRDGKVERSWAPVEVTRLRFAADAATTEAQ